MSKGPWESRVGMLLDPERHPQFVYSYKPPDSMHGGQPKIDWFACDKLGSFWLIEVKELPETRQSINLMTEVTAGQREGLTAVACSEYGNPLLAVGRGIHLYVFDWRQTALWMIGQENPLLPLSDAPITLAWVGPKAWREISLYELVYAYLSTAQIQTEPAQLSLMPEPSAPISKPKGSTPIVPLMRPLEP